MQSDLISHNSIQPADIDTVVRYHSEYYNEKYGFNHEFGEYVRKPLTDLVERKSTKERVWLIRDSGSVKGCITLVHNSDKEAQLRWYYVDETLRGKGLGSELIKRLIDFAREQDYRRVILWTVSLLKDARRMYEKHGFELQEEFTHTKWGLELTEQKFRLNLSGRE
ncbi:MAG: GNAT family N-acetyltransferase [Bacteroidota bacterium]